jgi:hypothetical protein
MLDRIGMGQLIQLIEAVANLLVLIQQHPQLTVLQREGGDDPDRAVEHPGGALVVVVSDLHDLVANPVDPAAEPPLGEPLSPWGERGLEPFVEYAGPGRPPMHRAQHLHVAGRVEPEAARQPVGHDLDDQVGDPVGVVLGE